LRGASSAPLESGQLNRHFAPCLTLLVLDFGELCIDHVAVVLLRLATAAAGTVGTAATRGACRALRVGINLFAEFL
jgi:hypothetical protein